MPSGVMLYELLTGSPPIDAKQFQRGAILEMLRMVREVDPPRPSTKLSTAEALPNIAANRSIEPARLAKLLQGELDWVVMKALEKDRTRRYETANGFARDIQRYLADEVVEARPPSRGYRLKKFVSGTRGAGDRGEPGAAGAAGRHRGDDLGVDPGREPAGGSREGTGRRGRARQGTRSRPFKIADARAEELKYRLGVSDMVLASAAYDNRDVVLAAERLDNVPPEQRGWEWRYLKQQTRGGLFTLYGHTGAVTSVSFSPDGTRIVTGSGDKTAKVWDARTGTPLLDLKGHTGGVYERVVQPGRHADRHRQ